MNTSTLLGPLEDVTLDAEARRRAVLTVCAYAEDAADARLLLEALGLDGELRPAG